MMIHCPAFYWFAFAILAGCTARPLPPLTSAHPASPAAAEASAPPPSTTLTADQGLPVDDSGAAHAGMATGHAAHRMPATTAPAAVASYTCPMHPEVRTTAPGRCPKCGMTLVPQKEDDSATGDSHAH
jgi:Heavy metal binding domain